MSAPWPPAFIRTAPPTEPGTPTAHSKPVSPAATVRRASTGRLVAPPARTTLAVTPRCRRSPHPAAARGPRRPGPPPAGWSPRPTTSTSSPCDRTPTSASAVAIRDQLVGVGDLDEPAGRTAHAVGAERSERPVVLEAVRRGTPALVERGRVEPGRGVIGRPLLEACDDAVGQRRDVTGADGHAEVARRAARRRACRRRRRASGTSAAPRSGRAARTASTSSEPLTPWPRRLARRRRSR